MKDFTTNWNKQELKAYILLYCAYADFVENEYEKDLILSIVDKEVYKEMHREFDADNDYQRIQKIQNSITALGLSAKQLNKIQEEVMDLFLADGNYDLLEKNMTFALKKMLQK